MNKKIQSQVLEDSMQFLLSNYKLPFTPKTIKEVLEKAISRTIELMEEDIEHDMKVVIDIERKKQKADFLKMIEEVLKKREPRRREGMQGGAVFDDEEEFSKELLIKIKGDGE